MAIDFGDQAAQAAQAAHRDWQTSHVPRPAWVYMPVYS